jgi:iron complex outermembrane receptor protein
MSIRKDMFLIALFSAVSLVSLPAWSQTGQDATDEEAGALEEVIVTGSRIRQNPLEVRTPVQFYDERDMDMTSSLSSADFLQRLPITGSAINRLNNSSGNLGFPPDGAGIGAGAAEIDLRNLGSKRTLVLVDGHRWIRGSSASGVSGAVDIHTIPNNAVKSIEISMDGASSVYGSDAIAGVVNIITVDDYDGLKATAYYGGFDEGDGEQAEADVRWGAEGERSRALINVSWTKQKEVFAGDRAISEYAIAGFPWGLSSGTPEGRVIFTDPRIDETLSITSYTVNPNYDPNCWTGGGGAGCDDFKPFELADRFNWQPYNYLLTPNRRISIFAKAEYDITENTRFRLTASYNNRESTSQAAPEPLFFGPDGGGGPWLENIFWPADHPYNPFGVDLGPDNIIFTGRRPIEAGPRIFDQNVDTYLVAGTIDGSFMAGSREIYWDLTGIYSENNANQVKQGAFNARNIATALGPTEICDLTPGCTPLNWIGPGAMTQAMLDYVTFTQKDQSSQELKDVTLNFTGDFDGFEAGPIGWAVGYEYREENGEFIPDSVVSRNETAGVPANPTAGGFDVNEFYGEIIVPIWAGGDFRRFDINAAARYSNYDLFDSDTVFSAGANWAPTNNLTLRVNFAQGFRAPNIGELFNTGSRFDASVSDPCSNAPPALVDNCAALGVPPGFETPNPQTSVTTGGNPDLVPETSDTWTAGFTWNVPFTEGWQSIDGMLLEINYYNIDIDDAIQPPDAQDVLDACVLTLDPFYCDNVTRTENGTITRIDGVLQNIGGIETSGIDWKFEFATAESKYGQFRLQWLNTYLLEYTETVQSAEGFIDIDREGTELGSPERGFPEWKSTLNLDWFYNTWSARLAFRYIDSMDEQCVGLVADFELQDDFCSNGALGNKIDSSLWTDFQITWSPGTKSQGQWAFTFGVDNLFDEDVPICFSCDLNSFDGTLYPIPGRYYYGKINYYLN